MIALKDPLYLVATFTGLQITLAPDSVGKTCKGFLVH